MTEEEFFTPGNRYRHSTWNINMDDWYEILDRYGSTPNGTTRYRVMSQDGFVGTYVGNNFQPFDDWVLISSKKKKEPSGFAKFIREHNL